MNINSRKSPICWYKREITPTTLELKENILEQIFVGVVTETSNVDKRTKFGDRNEFKIRGKGQKQIRNRDRNRFKNRGEANDKRGKDQKKRNSDRNKLRRQRLKLTRETEMKFSTQRQARWCSWIRKKINPLHQRMIWWSKKRNFQILQ